MARDTPLHILVGAQVFVVGVAMSFFLLARPSLLSTYAELGLALPGHVKLSLSSWLIPSVMVACALLCGGVILSSTKRGARLRATSGALIVSGFTLMATVLSAIVPLLR